MSTATEAARIWAEKEKFINERVSRDRATLFMHSADGREIPVTLSQPKPRVPRDDADLERLLKQTQRLLDERNAERFSGQSGVQIMREAERRNCDAVLSRDDSLPGGFRIRFVPKHVPAYLSERDAPAFLRRQAD